MADRPRNEALSHLRALREERGLPMAAVSRLAWLDQDTVRRVERGQVLGMQVSTLVRVAAALRCKPVDIVPGLAAVPRVPGRRTDTAQTRGA